MVKITPPKPTPRTSIRCTIQGKQRCRGLQIPHSLPIGIFSILSELMTDEPKAVLDVGCSTGLITRNLMEFGDRVDGVDFSENMIETAKILPNGNHPGINWICGPVEEVLLSPPYALITAGQSLHWMDWEVVFPRFKESLTRNGTWQSSARKTRPCLGTATCLRISFRLTPQIRTSYLTIW